MMPLPECEADAAIYAPLCPVCAEPLQRLNQYSHAWVCEHPAEHGLRFGDGILFYDWELLGEPVSADLARELLMVLPARLGGPS